MVMMPEPIPAGGEDLLRAAGLMPPFSVERLVGGRNNNVLQVTGTDGRKAVLKAYFHDPADPRDRLGAECAFLEAAAVQGISTVATLLGRDDSHHLGLFSRLDGRRVAPADVTPAAMTQALEFVLALNRRDRPGMPPSLPWASEACPANADHLATVARRLARLTGHFSASAIEREAAAFVENDVIPAWERIASRVRQELADHLDRPIGDERVLSPSDFGFHNALRSDDGRFSFFDFEYAGWDDPAKLVGDAFNQVQVPLPEQSYPAFRDAIAALSSRPGAEARRYDLLRPVYGIKWVAIMLNEFLAVDARRRDFAGPGPSLEERRTRQLAAARVKLANIAESQERYG